MMEDDVKEARVETKEELEGGETRKEVCRSTALVSRDGLCVACEKECAIE